MKQVETVGSFVQPALHRKEPLKVPAGVANEERAAGGAKKATKTATRKNQRNTVVKVFRSV